MIDLTLERAKLTAKIEKVKSERNQSTLLEDSTHIHEYKHYKESVRPDNDKYTRGTAYFIVKACTGCKTSQRLSFNIEG